jgi:hypothetical protein
MRNAEWTANGRGPEMRVAGILGTAKIALDTGHHADYI